MTSPVKNSNIFRNCIFYGFNNGFSGQSFTMLLNIMFGSYHGKKNTHFRFIKQNILGFFAFNEILFAKSQSLLSFYSPLTNWKSAFTFL